MTYGAHDALRDTVVDLRGHTDLTNLLEDSTAIDEGWPRDEQEFPVVVRVQPITESSSHRHKTTQRTFRFQFSVVAELEWRESQSAPTYEMARIMSKVADRLDIAIDAPELLPDGTASSSWQEVTGGRIGLLQDWQITTYTR